MISVIIVHYHIKQELFLCLQSIYNVKGKTPFEIIVVDNDEKKSIEKDLKEKFPGVMYIKNPKNTGFGAANNLGVRHAKGEFIFFLNSDTVLLNDVMSKLLLFFKHHKDAALVAPLLFGRDNKPYQQGSLLLGIKEGIVCLSFLNKLFPNNPISKRYFLKDWDKATTKEVDVVPGTAFMIRKELFETLGGFDKRFFLFFEEFDLCRRIKHLGYRLYITPQAKVKHSWGSSTQKRKDIATIFSKSRLYYFQKYYGFLPALLVHGITSFKKHHALLFILLAVSCFLNFYRLSDLMPFIGDQAWFYLSARDMLLTGDIPLVGITSSRPWLHQGPLWTYMLVSALWLGNFNPVYGAYLTAFLGTLSVLLLYFVASRMFSQTTGLIAAALYATSPLVVVNARFAYHTSPIPIFVILYVFFLYKWVRGDARFFIFSLLMLGILYNFELATISLTGVIFLFLMYGFWKKTGWFINLWNKKIIGFSLVAVGIPLFPVLLYDVSHGFPQTFGFMVWIVYKVFKPILYAFLVIPYVPSDTRSVIPFLLENIQKLLFLPDNIVSLALFLSAILFLAWNIFLRVWEKQFLIGVLVVVISFLVSIIGFLAASTPSDAYMPIFFPLVIIMIAIICAELVVKKSLFWIIIAVVISITFFNSVTLLRNNFHFTKVEKLITYLDRLMAVKRMIHLAGGEKYNIIGRAWLNDFPSYILNYTYLAWWLGHEPSGRDEKIKIYITEDQEEILIEKAKQYE